MKEYLLAQKFIDDNLNKDAIILEAGCGSSSKLDLTSFGDIHGIDISEHQLNRNSLITKKF